MHLARLGCGDARDYGGECHGVLGFCDEVDALPAINRETHRLTLLHTLTHQIVGLECRIGVARSPFFGLEEVAQAFTFHIGVGHAGIHATGNPPRGGAKERHQGGHEGHSNHKRVKGDTHGEAEGDGFENVGAFGDEGEENKEHDHGRCGHDSCALGVALFDRLAPITRAHILLAHTGD